MEPVERARRPARQVRIASMLVGGPAPVVIAGPCSVETGFVEQAVLLAATGIDALRAGVFKPRTRPESFQGLGAQAIPMLKEVRAATGLPLISEVLAPEEATLLEDCVDAYQVGARNMQNFRLLESLGRLGRPVILKRGMGSTVEEWVSASEYLRRSGNDDVILCERGIRTFEPATRSTLDLSSVLVAREMTDLPVIVDPSHAAGARRWVPPLALAALAVGADGVMVEAHPDPDSAWSDSAQSIDLEACRHLVESARGWARATRSAPAPKSAL